ncbi:MAG: ATP-binding protein [Planctomycetota bacterium]
MGIGVPMVLAGRYLGPSIVHRLSLPATEADFWPVLFNLIVMFVPVTIARSIFTWWLYLTWKRTASAGALVAFMFGATYALIAIIVPVQFYFSWYPPWMNYLWCCRVFGFSMGILMLIISRNERYVRESNANLRCALEQLKKAQQQAIDQAKLKALGKMAAGVVHDVNNSLTPLMAYAGLLETKYDLSPEAEHLARMIQMGVDDIASKINRLEYFYRNSRDPVRQENLDLAEVVQQSVELTKPKWQDQARAERQQISFCTTINSRPQVRGEAAQLRSVLTNLIFNACEAIEGDGTIQLRLDTSANEAVLAISDTGVGMTPEQLDRCLEPFYTSKPDGAGLGLSECYGIIRQHNGQLFVESTRGEGTTVQFLLPIDDHSEDFGSDDDPLRGNEVTARLEDNSPSKSIPRILCVDDDKHVLLVTSLLLNELPAEVEVAEDGQSAIDLLRCKSFDLVLCDQGLPGMDGISVLKAMKSTHPDLPVVMVSGWSLPTIKDRPHGFIAKPFSSELLFETVRQQLQLANPASS